jgi:hypothetical protein
MSDVIKAAQTVDYSIFSGFYWMGGYFVLSAVRLEDSLKLK